MSGAPATLPSAHPAHRHSPHLARTNERTNERRWSPNLPMTSSLPPLPCNGSPALCDLPVTSVVFPGVHNAMSSQADGFQAPNNLLGLEDALDAGIRAIQLDSCDCGGSLGLQMCHGECHFLGFIFLGYREPWTTFTNIKLPRRQPPGGYRHRPSGQRRHPRCAVL